MTKARILNRTGIYTSRFNPDYIAANPLNVKGFFNIMGRCKNFKIMNIIQKNIKYMPKKCRFNEFSGYWWKK